MVGTISVYILPCFILAIIGYAFFKKVQTFNVFLSGASKGISSAVSVLPALVGLVCAVSMLRASGVLEWVCSLFAPLLQKIGMPAELLPLALLKSVSGSGSLAMVKDVFEHSGPDSFSGYLASVMLGSSETTFYTLAVYYGAVNITKSRYTVRAAVVADIVGIAASVILCRILYV